MNYGDRLFLFFLLHDVPLLRLSTKATNVHDPYPAEPHMSNKMIQK